MIIKNVLTRLDPTALALLFLLIVFSLLSPSFATIANATNILEQSAALGITSLGASLVILTGGIDLSVGALAAMGGILAISIATKLGFYVACISAILIGGLIGTASGLVCTIGMVPPFVATLGTMGVVKGLNLFMTSGRSLSPAPDSFGVLRSPILNDSTVAVLLWISLSTFASVAYARTLFFLDLRAIGGNPRFARICGVMCEKRQIQVYAISGALACAAGVLLTSRLNAAHPLMGAGYELDAIAAAVLGGASLKGGCANPLSTFFGVLLLSTLRNGLSILNVDTYLQQIGIGFIVIVAMVLAPSNKKQ